MIRWLFLFLGDFENWLEGRFVFSRVLLHFLFCAEDAVYIGTHGLEFFVIILEITVSIVLGVLLNRKLLFFCPEVFQGRKLPIRRVLLQNLKSFLILGKSIAITPCTAEHPMSFKVPDRLLTDGQCRMMINGIQFIQALLEANELAVGKDYQFKGRYEAEKNAVIISLEKDEREW